MAETDRIVTTITIDEIADNLIHLLNQAQFDHNREDARNVISGILKLAAQQAGVSIQEYGE
jgi:hypothetical protein